MDSWIAVRGRGSTGFSTMDRGQGAGEVLRVQHHGQRTCRAFGSVDSGQREACGAQHHGQRSGAGMCTGFSTMDSGSVRGMGSGNGLGEWDGMGWDGSGVGWRWDGVAVRGPSGSARCLQVRPCGAELPPFPPPHIALPRADPAALPHRCAADARRLRSVPTPEGLRGFSVRRRRSEHRGAAAARTGGAAPLLLLRQR